MCRWSREPGVQVGGAHALPRYVSGNAIVALIWCGFFSFASESGLFLVWLGGSGDADGGWWMVIGGVIRVVSALLVWLRA